MATSRSPLFDPIWKGLFKRDEALNEVAFKKVDRISKGHVFNEYWTVLVSVLRLLEIVAICRAQ
jgi:hypothetical protein